MTQVLAGSEYCIPTIISPLITTTSDSITVSIGSDNAGFVVGNIVNVNRQGEINVLCKSFFSELRDTYSFSLSTKVLMIQNSLAMLIDTHLMKVHQLLL